MTPAEPAMASRILRENISMASSSPSSLSDLGSLSKTGSIPMQAGEPTVLMAWTRESIGAVDSAIVCSPVSMPMMGTTL